MRCRQCKRTKERLIYEIIEKLKLWRKLYNGVQRDGTLVRFSLEDGARKVGVSKRSLDDYILHIRYGKKYGFDFQKHRNDKVGVLRSYVRIQKIIEIKQNKEVKLEKTCSVTKSSCDI